MSGIIRWAEGGIRPLATLQANGWVCVQNQLPYRAVYQRGDEVIELEREGVAFYSLGDRRATNSTWQEVNGTWESIVERFALADPRKKIAAIEDLYNEIAADNDVPRFRFLANDERQLLLEALDALGATLEG